METSTDGPSNSGHPITAAAMEPGPREIPANIAPGREFSLGPSGRGARKRVCPTRGPPV